MYQNIKTKRNIKDIEILKKTKRYPKKSSFSCMDKIEIKI